MNPYHEQTPAIYLDEKFRCMHREINDAIQQNNMEYLESHVSKPAMGGPVNLSGDPLLNVVIAYGKSNLAIQLLEKIRVDDLGVKNFDGDTALHVAVMEGDEKVATALIAKKKELLHSRNEEKESPLHIAALYGKREMFWLLEGLRGDCLALRKNGDTVLHCAVMGKAPQLALEIARKYHELKQRRNSKALTPLQHMITFQDAFRSELSLGPFEALIYKCIPLEDSAPANNIHKDDIEKQVTQGNSEHVCPRGEVAADGEGQHFIMRYRTRFPPNYATLFDMLSIACIPARWIRFLTFRILKQLSARVEFLQQLKTNHKQATKLVEYLASDLEYWQFIYMGRTGSATAPPKPGEVASTHVPPGEIIWARAEAPATMQQPREQIKPKEHKLKQFHESLLVFAATMGDHELLEAILAMQQSHERKEPKTDEGKRWNESPLTLGAKMGLHEFVERILKVCPQSAVYPDEDGKNILQVAVQNGQEKIVGIIESMATGPNAVLPSRLLSSIHENTQNTILHFAAEITVKDNVGALQMQAELQWFEVSLKELLAASVVKRVKTLVPKDLEYSRNKDELTAQELFTEKHKVMVKDAKTQLQAMGRTYPGLVAAVVFASSFSIPGKNDKTGNPVFYKRTAFKVFSNAYVVGLSCAATSLVLFLSLLTSPYRERDFRRSLPTKYFFANMSFFLALVALLVAFTCNIYLDIYGGRKDQPNDIVPLVCELTIFPAVCCFVLLYQGATFGSAKFLKHVWR